MRDVSSGDEDESSLTDGVGGRLLRPNRVTGYGAGVAKGSEYGGGGGGGGGGGAEAGMNLDEWRLGNKFD